jgi:PAS domain S-box-containing protein
MRAWRDLRARIDQIPAHLASPLAILFTAVAVALRWILDPWLGEAFPLATLYGAVAAAVVIGGGTRAALTATAGYVACDYLFIEPRGTLALSDTSSIIGALVYAATCAIVIGLGQNSRRAHDEARARGALLQTTLATLERSERELADFFDNASVALHWVGPDGIILRANQAELDLLGFAREEYVGRHISAFHVDRDVIDAALVQLFRGDRLARYPARMRCKDGSIKKVVIDSSSLWDNGRFVHSRCFMFDVTEQKREEETRSLLAAIVDASDDAIVSTTLEGIVISWNAGAQRLFGYSPAEVVGRSIDLIIPLELRQEERQILHRIRQGERVDHFETVRMAKDGRRLDVSLTLSPVRDGSGAVIGASKVARDISERKQIDSALRETDRRKDEFLATLAHELRNPLAPIRHSLEILLRGAGDPGLFRHATDILGRQLSHLVRLVDDLLDVSRISRDTLVLRKTRVDLRSIIAHALEASRPLAERDGQRIEVSLPDLPIYLDGDSVRLTQVFSNLFNNACQYTETGGRIWLTVEREHTEAVVIVRDSGIGMPTDQLDGIFEMFAQVGDDSERPRRGLGVGLTLVRRLVQLHGGTVTARSDGRGLGSEFEVRLPILDTYPEVPQSEPVQFPGGGARRILVVDDNLDSADSIATLLRLSGHLTFLAHDGIEAVEAAARLRPDVVLLDIGLPKISGIEACRRIRGHAWGKAMIVVALTGWGQEHDRRSTREAGFDAHLVKPVDFDDLLQLLSAPVRLS